MTDPAPALALQFLDWLALRPRRYGEVMEAWRTSCPRLPVWETVVEQGLVRVDRTAHAAMADCPVVLTEAGRNALASVAG